MVSGFEFAERGRRARVEGRPEEALGCYEAAVFLFEGALNSARAQEARRCVVELRAEIAGGGAEKQIPGPPARG